MAETSSEKTLDPTPHRRQMARDSGDVVRSQDLSSAAMLLGGLIVLLVAGGALCDSLANVLTDCLGGRAWIGGTMDTLFAHLLATLKPIAGPLLTILVLTLLLSAAANLLQTGVRLMPHKLAPDLARIDPFQGLARIFSGASVARLGFGMLKVVVVAGVAGSSLYSQRETILSLAGADIPEVAASAWQICIWTAVKAGLALLALAVLDYGYRWWSFERSLRMTPQEVREEMRSLQGNPQVVARRRRVQRQVSFQRLSAALPKADVVITGGADLAVAIKYDTATMRAPVVVAKGIGPLAGRIDQLARQHAVAQVEKQALADALYRHVEPGGAIPERWYAEVAAVLAEVYKGQALAK